MLETVAGPAENFQKMLRISRVLILAEYWEIAGLCHHVLALGVAYTKVA